MVTPTVVAGAAAEAVRAAAAEGLTLERSERNATSGFRGVYRDRRRFAAKIGHSNTHLGTFDTAEEAALAYARVKAAKAPAEEEESCREASYRLPNR